MIGSCWIIVNKSWDELKLFDELDYDKTGVLNRQNILKGLNKLKNHPSKNKYASELLQKCDVSSDGVVDFGEFKAFVEEKEKELLRLFLEIDKSNDMKLQPEELEIALRKAGKSIDVIFFSLSSIHLLTHSIELYLFFRH